METSAAERKASKQAAGPTHGAPAAGNGATSSFIDPARIEAMLANAAAPDPARVRDIVDKALALKGLAADEVAVLLRAEDPDLVAPMLDAARQIKDAIYGKRLVLFAPLYFSNYCVNNCLYCAFRRDNRRTRRRLSLDEVEAEVRALIRQGHKRLLVIGGEEAGPKAVDYMLQVIERVYATKEGRGEVRRINVESAPMSVADFRRLKATGIGTYVLFQETYHPTTYQKMHPAGPKADYLYRLTAMDRAMEAGIDDVGIGALFGLHDYRFEVLAMMAHAQHLDSVFGVGPHTISVPRIEPADGAPAAQNPPHPVNDETFKKIVAILRMAVPYTGIILSTRESAALRTELLHLGVSQMSAGSRTEPGGYNVDAGATAQFSVGDHRSLDEVIADIASHGFIPSFCTGCYRKGRTGQDFMDLAKPGLIRMHCLPNALLTFREYLLDYASPATRVLGEKVINEQLDKEVPEARKPGLTKALGQVDGGERDIYF